MTEGYASPIVGGGGALIRDEIESRNYAPGVSGWRIGADDTAEFNDVVVRDDLQSANYAAGLAGWKLFQSGLAELNELTARGTVQSANFVPDAFGWQINTDGNSEFAGIKVRDPYAGPGTGRIEWTDSLGDQQGSILGDALSILLPASGFCGFSNEGKAAWWLNGSTAGLCAQGDVDVIAGADVGSGDLLLRAGGTGKILLDADVTECEGTLFATDQVGAGTLRAGAAAAAQVIVNANQVYALANPTTGGDLYLNYSANANTYFGYLGRVLVRPSGDVEITGTMDCGAPTAGTTANCNLSTQGTLQRLRKNTSSLRYKAHVRDLGGVSVEQILALRPRTFNRRDDRDRYTGEPIPITEDSARYAGFIAEEAEALGLIGWCTYEHVPDEDNLTEVVQLDGFAYDLFTVAHQLVLREHQARIAELEARLAALEGGHRTMIP